MAEEGTLAIAALASQRDLPDLARLPRLAGEIAWLPLERAAEAEPVLVLAGLLASEEPAEFSRLVQSRLRARLGTLVVARIQAAPFGRLLGAPAPIEVVVAERDAVHLEQRSYRVPCSVAFQTSLPSATALTGTGGSSPLLAYRPTTVSGEVILCGAVLAGRRPGSDLDDQRDLLRALVARLGPAVSSRERVSRDPTPAELSPAELLAAAPEHGSAVLLALVGVEGQREPAAIAREAERRLAVRLDQAAVIAVLAQLAPDVGVPEVERALRDGGWGAFLRRMVPASSLAVRTDDSLQAAGAAGTEAAL
jgi:hypothetical protein